MKFTRYGNRKKEDQKSVTFAKWLSARGQSDEAIERFWSMFVLPVFNCRIDEVAAYDAIEFTRAALLSSTSDAAIGYPKKGLSYLIGHPAFEYLCANGAEVINRTSVEAFASLEGGGFRGSTLKWSAIDNRCRHIRVGTQRAEQHPSAIRYKMRQTGIATDKVPVFADRGGSSLVRATSDG